ncbi:MAG: alanine racemase [Propionibacteriales bacterium]|nr:alanine racemase [Propionibacteriales bacterium]
MPLTLYVDGDRWRAHLRKVADSHPGIVPVAKGNGYGFGVGRLARRAGWLGRDLMAVGTYAEAPEALSRFDGDVLVLSPWRPFEGGEDDPRLIHTVGRAEDLAELAQRARPRVLLEALTSMRRHGFTAEQLAVVDANAVHIEGLALHLPMAGDRLAEAERWLGSRPDLPGMARVFVSHLDDQELAVLQDRHPDLQFRPRIGTALWLGDREALRARATVVDVHPVSRGERIGYRQRRLPRSGHVLVVSGGTAHGIGLEAPTSGTSIRQRAVSVARGGLDATGLALSPFTVAGRKRWFVEPPHMQVSLLFLPADTVVPRVGDEIQVDVRFTTTTFDRVEIG